MHFVNEAKKERGWTGRERDPVFGDLHGLLLHWAMPANTLLSIFVGVVAEQVMFVSPGQPQGFDPGPARVTRAGLNLPSWTPSLHIPPRQIGVQGPQRLQNLS